MRDYLRDTNSVAEIVDFGSNKIFDEVNVPTAITILKKQQNNANKNVKYTRVTSHDNIKSIIPNFTKENYEDDGYYVRTMPALNLQNNIWMFADSNTSVIIKRMNKSKNKLNDLVDFFSGIKTSSDPIFIVSLVKFNNDRALIKSEATGQTHWIEKNAIKPFLKGVDIRGYVKPKNSKWLVWSYNEKGDKILKEDELKTNHPLLYDYLKINKQKLTNRAKKYKVWYALDRTRYTDYKLIKNQKILSGWSKGKTFTIDNKGYYFVGTTGIVGMGLKQDSDISHEMLLGVLNSSLMRTYIESKIPKIGDSIVPTESLLKNIPIPEYNSQNASTYNQIENLTLQRLSETNIDRQRELEDAIDHFVNKLYGIEPAVVSINNKNLQTGNYFHNNQISEIEAI